MAMTRPATSMRRCEDEAIAIPSKTKCLTSSTVNMDGYIDRQDSPRPTEGLDLSCQVTEVRFDTGDLFQEHVPCREVLVRDV